MKDFNALVQFAQFAGGLGLFLYGMQLMSTSLQKVAGDRLKRILEKLTSNRFIGLAVGCIVTMIIQSSSATTVMIVGFVNAGLMNLSQALSVVLGANIGTTVTAQILALNISALALPAIAVGAIFVVFIKKYPKLTYTGEIILGFGMLFFGMTLMTAAFAPLKDMPEVQGLFVTLSDYRVLAALIGALLTLILQSSSATIGITMALATNGLIDYQTSVALVLGENIGTTITANLAAIGGSRSAKQAAFGHFLFNFIGVCYMLILLKPFLVLINFITPGEASLILADGSAPNVARHIANAHTLFNIINALIFIPLLPLLAKLCEFFIKSDTTQDYKYTHLANAIMSLPETAVAQVRVEAARMSTVTLTMLNEAQTSIRDENTEGMSKTGKYEETLDGFRDELLTFIDRLSARPISAVSLQKLETMRIAIHNMEEIGDVAKTVLRRAEKLTEKQLSETAQKELYELFEKVTYFATETFRAFATNRAQPNNEALEDEIDGIYRGLRQNHMKRLEEGLCDMSTGMYFMDIISGLETIADYIFAISQLNVYKKA